MQVFDLTWIESIRRRYGRLPRYERPIIYSIAVDEEYQDLRTEIESWVGHLPIAAKDKVIPKLHSSENFQQTYNELAVGHTIRQLGFKPEYEKPIDGFTPDWFVHPRDGAPAFVVEAFTSNPPQGRVANLRRLNHLLGRLYEIPVGVALSVRANEVSEIPDQRESKKIKKAVERWLMAGSPAIGDRAKFGGFTFEVIHKNANYKHVFSMVPAGLLKTNTFWVDGNLLKQGIEEKVNKYSFLGRAGTPLTVGVVADFYTGLGRDDLDGALFGDEAVQLVMERTTGNIIESRLTRRANGLFARTGSALSAVLWVSRESGNWKSEAVHNPNALNPLPDTAFT